MPFVGEGDISQCFFLENETEGTILMLGDGKNRCWILLTEIEIARRWRAAASTGYEIVELDKDQTVEVARELFSKGIGYVTLDPEPGVDHVHFPITELIDPEWLDPPDGTPANCPSSSGGLPWEAPPGCSWT